MPRAPEEAKLRRSGGSEATPVIESTRVTIDVDVGSDPISGHIRVAGRSTETFVGWSALAELLEQARAGTPSAVGRDLSPPEKEAADV
jgi:hypothetical protein